MNRTCFVMMPFDRKYEDLLERPIMPSIKIANLTPVLAKSYEPGPIPEQIKRDIKSAAIAIAVLTAGNWNVAYEMGLAHMADVPVIPLIESAADEIPRKV